MLIIGILVFEHHDHISSTGHWSNNLQGLFLKEGFHVLWMKWCLLNTSYDLIMNLIFIQCSCSNLLYFNFWADVNECTDGSHTCDSTIVCMNTVGSFNCMCDPGYEHPTGSTTICNGRTIWTVKGFGRFGCEINYLVVEWVVYRFIIIYSVSWH